MAEKKRGRRGRGEGTIYQRKDGRWVAELTTEDGKRKLLYAKTQEKAVEQLHQAQYEKRRGILATGPRQKLGDHLRWWLDEVHRQKIRETSYVRYKHTLEKHIIPVLGEIQLQKLTTQRLQTFYNKKLEGGLSPSSIHTLHKVLHKGLEYAVHVHLISYNPSNNVSLPRQAKRKVQPLTLEQAQHLLKVAQKSSLEVLITLALATGMRHGELLALRWEDINFEQGSVYVHRTVMYVHGVASKFVEGAPKTESSERIIPISQTMCGILKDHKTRQNEVRLRAGSGWQNLHLVFCTRTGGFLRGANVRNQFHRLVEKAGLPPMRIHDLRHTASTLFRSMGVDLKVVQEILGHSSLDMTANVYSHVLPSMQKEAVERMDRLFQ